MGAIYFGGMTLSATTSGFLFRSTPKGTIPLPTIGTREEESFAAVGERMLVGMTMEVGRGSFI